MVKRKLIQFLTAFLYNGNLPGLYKGTLWQQSSKSVCLPALNCYSCPAALGACPIGALQSSFSGVFMKIPFYVLGSLLLFALLLGRLICGWGCPFGLLQELLYKIPSFKIRKNCFTKRLSCLKYFILLFFVLLLPLLFYFTSGIGIPAFCKYICPAGTLEAALPLAVTNDSIRNALGTLFAWKFFLLALLLLAAVFIYRPFCRFICPLGAFYGLFNKFTAFGIKVDAARCTSCKACSRTCLLDCKIAGDRECIACGDCQKACPVQAISFGKKF